MPNKLDTQYFFFMFWNYKFIYLYTLGINRPYLSKMAVERIFFFYEHENNCHLEILYFYYKFFPMLLQRTTIGPKNCNRQRWTRWPNFVFCSPARRTTPKKIYSHTLLETDI